MTTTKLIKLASRFAKKYLIAREQVTFEILKDYFMLRHKNNRRKKHSDFTGRVPGNR